MKKTFSRQLALTLSLLLVTLLLLSTAFQLLFSRYMVQRMRAELEDAAEAMAEMAAVLSDNSYASQSLLRVELNYTARTTGSDVLLVTTDGIVAACSDGQQSCPHLGYGFIMGYFADKGIKENRKYFWAALLIPWILHGSYDFCLAPELGDDNVAVAITALALAVLSIALTVAMIVFVKKELRRRVSD